MNLTRRSFIHTSFAFAALSIVPKIARASLLDNARKLHFYNTHTGETLKVTYWEQGNYHPHALQEIAHVLRDHRNNKEHAIDQHLLDVLANLHSRMESTAPFEVISGYRSPESNSMLHAHTSGVAKYSQHMSGKAIDIRLPGRQLSQLHKVALSLRQGGVGYYPASDFVHVDTGPIRQW